MIESAQLLRERVAWACRILADVGYADLTLGHVSARIPGEETFFIKRRGVTLDQVGPDDVIELPIEAAGEAAAECAEFENPANVHLETVLHTEVYRLRPDVGAVVHGHPPFGTALSSVDSELELLTHDAVLFYDGVNRFDEYADLITEAEQGRAVAEALGERRAVLLRNHGVLVVGKDVPWAVLGAVTLERSIRLQSLAGSLGGLRPIARAEAERLFPEKYTDSLVEEYWAAWLRRVAQTDGGKALS